MANQKMIVEYIRKGYRGKRIVKDGIEFVQCRRGPRIGVFVALNDKQFGWSLVHLKGENREPVKNISWKKGVEMAIARAEGKTNEKVPDSIAKQFKDFKKRVQRIYSKKLIPVEGSNFSISVATDEDNKHFALVARKGRLHFTAQTFQAMYKAMSEALAENVHKGDPDTP
jgi:hypothetical protein